MLRGKEIGMRAHLRWTAVVGSAELVGFLIPVVAGVLWADTAWAIPILALGGAAEGAILAWAQGTLIRRAVPGLPLRTWVIATALAAAFAYVIGMLPSFTVSWWRAWPTAVVIASGAILALALLLSIGTVQWLVLRRLVGHAWLWLVGSSLAWLIGLGGFFITAPPLWQEGQPVLLAVVIGLGGGVVMATLMAAATGATWILLIRHQPPLSAGAAVVEGRHGRATHPE